MDTLEAPWWPAECSNDKQKQNTFICPAHEQPQSHSTHTSTDTSTDEEDSIYCRNKYTVFQMTPCTEF